MSERSQLTEVIDAIERLAAAGVRVLEVGDGPTRVRVELEPGSAPSLIRRAVRDMLQRSAPDHPAARAAYDPERADDIDDQPSAEPQGEAAEQAGDPLDVAHLT